MSEKSEQDVLELLEEFKSSAVSSERKHAKTLLMQHQQLCDVVCEIMLEKFADQQTMENLCQELLTLYYRGSSSKCLCIQTLPVAIGTYLCAVGQGYRKYCAHLETFLLSIYNNEVSKQPSSGTSAEEIRLPPLINSSIYHRDPSSLLSGTTFIDSAINRYRSNQPVVVKVGPYPSCASLNAENRFLVLSRLWRLFNAYLNFVNPSIIVAACRMCMTLCRCGFDSAGSNYLVKALLKSDKIPSDLSQIRVPSCSLVDTAQTAATQRRNVSPPRLHLHPTFLLEMLNTAYFAVFTPKSSLFGLQALEDLHQRAIFELYDQVILVTNALINDLTQNVTFVAKKSGRHKLSVIDSVQACVLSDPTATSTLTISLSDALTRRCRSLERAPTINSVASPPEPSTPPSHSSSSTSSSAARRRLVTNASLRIKKLPDDIPLRPPTDAKSRQSRNSTADWSQVDGGAASRKWSTGAMMDREGSEEATRSSPLPDVLEVDENVHFGRGSIRSVSRANTPSCMDDKVTALDINKQVRPCTPTFTVGIRTSNSTLCMKDLQKRVQAAEYATCLRDMEIQTKSLKINQADDNAENSNHVVVRPIVLNKARGLSPDVSDSSDSQNPLLGRNGSISANITTFKETFKNDGIVTDDVIANFIDESDSAETIDSNNLSMDFRLKTPPLAVIAKSSDNNAHQETHC